MSRDSEFEELKRTVTELKDRQAILDVIHRRVTTRKPAAYLVNKIYMRGLPFYVDERTIVPRSTGTSVSPSVTNSSDSSGKRKASRPSIVEAFNVGFACIAVPVNCSTPLKAGAERASLPGAKALLSTGAAGTPSRSKVLVGKTAAAERFAAKDLPVANGPATRMPPSSRP